MAQYTFLDSNEIQKIGDYFDIDKIISTKVLTGGSENTNILLTTGKGKYIMTICERKSPSEVLTLVKTLGHLNHYRFRTNKVIYSPRGEYSFSYNSKEIIIRTYLEGDILDDLNTSHIFTIGTIIEKLHRVPVPDFLPPKFSYGIESFEECVEWEDTLSFKEWMAQKKAFISGTLDDDLPRCFIHGDVFSDNVVISHNGIPVIIDFEEACYYYRIFDIGMAALGLCRSGSSIDLDNYESLLKGYGSNSNLDSREMELVPAFIIYAAVATAFWRYRQFNIIHPDQGKESHYLEMKDIADWVQSHKDHLIDLTMRCFNR